MLLPRTEGNGFVTDHLLSLLPDAIWFSRTQGQSQNLGIASVPSSKTNTVDFGFSRTWDIADTNFNYWRSTVDNAFGLPDATRWQGQGIDVGGNIYFGKFYMYAGLSYYDANNIAQWSNSNEGSFTGSFLLTWQSKSGLDVKAGITSYDYGFDMLDYGGFNRYGMQRYELALDFSRIAKEKLERDVQLKFLASFGGNENQSIWPNAEYNDREKNLFAGFMFTLPL